MKFNTGIASLMSLLNAIYDNQGLSKEELKIFITLLNPFAPHVTEEMWEQLGLEGMLNQTQWPQYDDAKTVDDEIEIVIQINGKIKEKLVIAANLSKEEVAAKATDAVKSFLDGKSVVKTIVVPGKLVNLVVK